MRRISIRRPIAAVLGAGLILLAIRAGFSQKVAVAAGPQGHGAGSWGAWPQGADPAVQGRKIAENLLARPLPWEAANGISYQEACTAYGSLRFAAQIGDKELVDKLAAHYQPLLTDRGKTLITKPNHVDMTVMGILPLQIFILTASPEEKKIALEAVAKLPPVTPVPAAATGGVGGPGFRGAGQTAPAEAQAQWEQMKLSHQEEETRWLMLGKSHADVQWARPRGDGLTDQTRFWVDDMFMITSIQCQAYRATGNRVYLDRAAREMAAYLDQLQQPNGLFFHADNARFYWGRGNGWFAVGMAELLSDLPADHPERARIMDGYKKMMAGLLKYQAPSGMWRELIDHEEAWEESSSTGMFTFALATGVRHGWLEENPYKEAARKGWTALASHINVQGNVTDICAGTGTGGSVQYYLNRPRVAGDYHGQAGYIWAAWAMLQPGGK